MTNISIQIYTEDPNQVATDLGCQGLHGYLNQDDIVKKAVEYAKHTLLAHQDWPDKYRAMFDATDGVRVLPIYMHPSSVKGSNVEENGKTSTDTSGSTWNDDMVVPGSEQIPFICIGDALHALPPVSSVPSTMCCVFFIYIIYEQPRTPRNFCIQPHLTEHNSIHLFVLFFNIKTVVGDVG